MGVDAVVVNGVVVDALAIDGSREDEGYCGEEELQF